MSVPKLDPESVATELASKLSARTRHVSFLLGAGAAKAAGLPDLTGLQNAVLESPHLNAKQRTDAEKLFAKRNLEEALSYLRRLGTILDTGESLGGLDSKSAQELHTALTNAIVPALDTSSASREPFDHFASWSSGAYYSRPIEIFTINYDLLIETSLETIGTPYFDGFVGTIAAHFRPELVDPSDSSLVSDQIPPSFVRLWKLHGSVNWEETTVGPVRFIARRGAPVAVGRTAAIYPSDEKYDQSRRVPFVVLMDRFRRALAMPESITLISGYSFGDQHLNEILFDAARRHPRSEIVVLSFGSIPTSVSTIATSTRNICVLATKEGIVGGQLVAWERADDLAGIWEGAALLLPDFKYLAKFLATRARIGNVGA